MTDASRDGDAFPADVAQLEDLLSRPPSRLLDAWSRMDGNLVFLGVGGKMGPSMARMAQRALQQVGARGEVIGVSRFRDEAVRQRLESGGIRTIACDLLDSDQVERLPDAPYVVSMSGFKFGASQHPELAWAANCYLPALVCRRYPRAASWHSRPATCTDSFHVRVADRWKRIRRAPMASMP